MNDSEAGTSDAVTEDFDVFLNHRGPDVKATFVAHLEDALRCAGFRPFLDVRSLMKGNPALKSIDQALDIANVHVAVVSKRYAESKYCLNELVAMMRSGKPVVPVFYDVEPVDLRWVENGRFAGAFEKHKSKGKTEKKLQEWRDALGELAGITGFCLSAHKHDEAKLKQEVVNEVARLTPSNDPVEVEWCRVGLEGPTKRYMEALENMGAGTGMLGLVGMGGVGKTTLAREIYNHFVAQKKFRCMTFLEIHRDPSSSNVEVRPTWLRKLRKQLLWDLLRVQSSTSSGYSSWFKKVSTLGSVLIVVDDVHKLGQFEALIPFASDLHSGSRIIITSRDRSILNNVVGRMKVDHHHVYDVSTLSRKESNILFNWYAFHADEAPEGYKDLAEDVVEACGGLPLALKVIGSSLFDKRLKGDGESIWREAVHALRLSSEVMGVLRWSYDILPKFEKHMFVDITCLFNGQSSKDALAYWKSCKDCMCCGGVPTPHTSLQSLMDKNLVVVGRYASFKVHDLLVDLGQEIGRRRHLKDKCAEIALLKKQGTNKTIGLNLVGSRKRKFEAENFANMPNLHFLALPDGCVVDGDLTCISRELRWLQWRSMPYEHIPMGLDVSHVTSLNFSKSTNLAFLWVEPNCSFEGCPNLSRLNLSDCTSITKIPDSIGQSSQLQHLMLSGCRKLKMLPESVGQLQVLENLNLSYCTNLKALPNSIGLASRLHELNLESCTKLKKIPESIGQLKELKTLKLFQCTNLKALPDSIGGLSCLEWLQLLGCPSFMKLPPLIGLSSSLKLLWLGCSGEIETISDDKIGTTWIELETLCIINWCGLGSLIDYGALKNLREFNLEDNSLIELPESFGLLMSLETLSITCKRLQCLPNSIGELKMLEILTLSGCDNLKRMPKTLDGMTSLQYLRIIECCLIRKLPRFIGELSGLRALVVTGCKNLQKLSTSIKNLKGLQEFILEDCGSVEAMGALTTLQGLPIWGSTSTIQLPASLGCVSTLAVRGGNITPSEYHYTEFVGAGQVLEEDESGFLKAYHDESSGVTKLLRDINRMRNST